MYINDFTFLSPIETGGFSTVWEVKYKYKKYALKMISKQKFNSKIEKKNLKMEIKIHKQLKHENIIKLYNSFEDDFFTYILLELCEDDLFYFLERREQLTTAEIINISRQIIESLVYLNEMNVIHGDLKLENILLIGDKVKLCDFGLSSQNFFHYSYVGTPEYMAPEIIKRQLYNNKVDIWSFGIILYNLVFGKSPFLITSYSSTDNSVDIKNTQKAICNNEIFFPKETIFNEIIEQCLKKEQTERISIENLQKYKLFQKKSNQIIYNTNG